MQNQLPNSNPISLSNPYPISLLYPNPIPFSFSKEDFAVFLFPKNYKFVLFFLHGKTQTNKKLFNLLVS